MFVCLQHIEKVFKHKELEGQLADAKLAQATLQATQDKEKGLAEKELVTLSLCHRVAELPTYYTQICP